MSDVKKKLMAEIDAKIARKKQMAARAVERNTIDQLVITYIDNIEEINAMGMEDFNNWNRLAYQAKETLQSQLRTHDPKCDIEVSWRDGDTATPQVNGVLIKWSGHYQIKHKVDPELFIDIMSLLFKDKLST